MKAKLKFARPVAAAFGLIALLGVIPANAADAVMEEPPAPAPVETAPLNTWSGPYAGVTLGYGFAGTTELPGLDIDTDGFTAHGFAGYNLENGGFVYGIEGDLGYAGLRGDDLGIESKSGFDGSLRARIGVAVTPNVLLYATAGGAAQNLKVEDGFGNDDSSTMFGWTAGVGTDIKVTERIFGRVEYRYTDYGSKDFDFGGGPVEIGSNDNRVMVGLGVKF